MRVIICGGGLQGVELCFLAKQAGWSSILLDIRHNTPASALADQLVLQDICSLNTAPKEIRELFFGIDLVIPATENMAALQALTDFCKKHAIPCAFDFDAYHITASKARSRDLFIACATPIPTPFTASAENALSFPLIAKPIFGSGSQGVQIFHTLADFEKAFPLGIATPHWLFEAYCFGPSYSIEICGTPNNYTTFDVTALQMDALFDCEAVTTPSGLSLDDEKALTDEITRLATALNLHGLMDLEVIWTPQGYVVLEIDARFPSQTPTAVYLASGVNLIEHLAACFIPYTPSKQAHTPHHVWFGHVLYDGKQYRYGGEHIMTNHGPLHLASVCPPFEVLIGQGDTSGDAPNNTPNDMQNDTVWVATLMLYDSSFENVEKLRENCLQNLVNSFPLASTA